MRIKKISPTTPANGNIENQYGTSQTNAYSEEYVNSLNTYSTTETRIGTWIDGKPLYRSVANTSVSLTANTWTNLRYKSGEKALINCIISDSNNFTDANSCLTYPVIARLYGNYIQIYSFINTTVKCVIIECTKTTD